jgi:hypothetical protein
MKKWGKSVVLVDVLKIMRFPGDHDTPATPKGRPSGTKIEWPPSSPDVVFNALKIFEFHEALISSS